ncbi:MAG: abortive infection family protein [Flavobacteriales bacterium]|nr:abortive infection family protein [Flavobacteriales bacterium]
MANLKYNEKQIIESSLGMRSGYVLDFNHFEFDEFIKDSVGLNIFSQKYEHRSNSKANRLRKLWTDESNTIVAQLLEDLFNYKSLQSVAHNTVWEESERKACFNIVETLKKKDDGLKMNSSRFEEPYDSNLKRLRESIDRHLSKSEFDWALDRLHTYMVHYTRKLCGSHKLQFETNETLNAIFGKYVRSIEENKRVDSKMSVSILKKSISVLSDFNGVRNNQSFAHANSILNHFEAKLIVSHVIALVEFLEDFESMYFADLYADDNYEMIKEEDLPF